MYRLYTELKATFPLSSAMYMCILIHFSLSKISIVITNACNFRQGIKAIRGQWGNIFSVFQQ